MKAPTARQLEVLRMVHRVTRRTGVPPTMRELGLAMGTSPKNIEQHLDLLRKKRLVDWETNRARTLQLTEQGRQVIATGDSVNVIEAKTCDCGATHFGAACPMCAIGIGEAALAGVPLGAIEEPPEARPRKPPPEPRMSPEREATQRRAQQRWEEYGRRRAANSAADKARLRDLLARAEAQHAKRPTAKTAKRVAKARRRVGA